MWSRTLMNSTTKLANLQKVIVPSPNMEKNFEQMRKRKRTNTIKRAKMERNWINTINCNSKLKHYNLMSYNILAQELLMEHMQLYTHIPLPLLQWEERLIRLSREICKLQPDILCVQEMQYEHLSELLKRIRQQRQLEYVFKKKTNNRNDGCAIIYDKEKFRLIDELPLEYFSPGNHSFNRGNIAILAKFSICEEPSKQFVVATTHLLFNPKRENIRVEQARLLLQTLKNFSELEQQHLPVILTGDFNSTETAAAVQLILQPHENLKLQMLDFGPGAVSTIHDNWTKVDHIFYNQTTQHSKHNLCICCFLQLPTFEQCEHQWQLPNDIIGSDHFSLAIRFTIA